MIGEIIKQERLKRNESQEKLSQQLGVSRQTIANWESGRTVPATDYLLQFCQLYGLSFDQLLGLSEPMEKERRMAKNYLWLVGLSLILTTVSASSMSFFVVLFCAYAWLLFFHDCSHLIIGRFNKWKHKKGSL